MIFRTIRGRNSFSTFEYTFVEIIIYRISKKFSKFWKIRGIKREMCFSMGFFFYERKEEQVIKRVSK